MSQTLGRMVTCDRCGKTVFEPVRDAKGDEGWRNNCLYFESTSGWVEPRDYTLGYDKDSYTNRHTSICPECESIREDIMEKFWRNE